MSPEQRRTNRGPGSRWAQRVGKRIALIQHQSGLTQDQFAERCGVSKPTVNGWLNGAAVPRGDSLASIAESFGVSVDWLLDGVNAANDAQQLPAFRGQWRDDQSLQADFAAAVLRAGGFRPTGGVSFGPTGIDFDAVVRDVAREISAHELRYLEFMRQLAMRMKLQAAAEHTLLALEPIADAGDGDIPEKLDRARAAAADAAHLLDQYYTMVSDAFEQLPVPKPDDCRYLRPVTDVDAVDPREFQSIILTVVRNSGVPEESMANLEAEWGGDAGLEKISKLRREWSGESVATPRRKRRL